MPDCQVFKMKLIISESYIFGIFEVYSVFE